MLNNKNLFNNNLEKIIINKIDEKKMKIKKNYIEISIYKKNSNFCLKKRKYPFLIISIFFLSSLLFIINKYSIINVEESIDKSLISFDRTIEMNAFEEQIHIQNYVDLVLNGTLIDKDKIYYPSNNPLISIVISVYNGEAYLKTALISIQNQDLKNIEIIMVDDGSKDNSINLIKELMKTEPRIILLENGENRGPLYTKTKGVLHAKGKYVMTLDEDDIYCQRNAFSSLYIEAEKNNLDILAFMFVYSGAKISARKYSYPIEKKEIMHQPKIGDIMFYFNSKGQVIRDGGSLVHLFTKTNLFKKVITQIDEKYMKEKMFYHDDFIIYFLLTRNAYSMKFVDRIFYICLKIWDEKDPKVKFRATIKRQDMDNKKCFGFLIFLEMFLEKTQNNYKDKKIAFSQLDTWYLKQTICQNNTNTRDKAIRIFKLYLDNKFISKEDKIKIKNFIDNIKNKI